MSLHLVTTDTAIVGRISGERSRHEERKELVEVLRHRRAMALLNPSYATSEALLEAHRAIEEHDMSRHPDGVA